MPIPRTWVEELIVEWLHLEGYLVEANFPVTVAPAGGRGEADVVGAKVVKGELEILHIETGQLAGGKSSIEAAIRKFSGEVEKSLTLYFSQRFSSCPSHVKYKPIYVPTYWTNPTVKGIEAAGIRVVPLPEFIRHKVLPTIGNWKQDPPHAPKGKGTHITLPESFWLLQFLDHLQVHKLLR